MGMKGHPQSNSGGGGSGGGWMMRNKMVVVVVVILVGVMGVMVIQKVKDRRFFNLVIKDKDRQILSLNLLLQKERQYAKENKRKNQDLNAKLYSFRTQKIELVNKIMEMRSIISSMKEEQRALELTVDEKQNEIKRKESEITDLKNNLQTPPKIWSMSSNNRSNHEVNLTSKVATTKVKESEQKPNVEEILKPNVKVQNPKDEDGDENSDKLASLKRENDDVKNEIHNVTNGVGLGIKGRSFFIGATESQRDKSTGQNEKSQLKGNLEESQTKVKRFKFNKTKGENESETEMDMITFRKGSEDQDYKKQKTDFYD